MHNGMIDNSDSNNTLTLGTFLRDCRSRLKPHPTVQGKRRTPGLRREEVAALAGVSVTWYTWLEQGRGGPPSKAVLERLSRALELDAAGRETLFLLGHQRPPPLQSNVSAQMTPALQRVIDAMPHSPAYVKTLTWDIIGWNIAAATLADYAPLPSAERNVLRRLFSLPAVQAAVPDWEAEARFALAAFRLDAARAGENSGASELIAELQETSADFRRLWAKNETRQYGVHTRRVQHPRAGTITFECSTFSVNSPEGLNMLVYTPISSDDAEALKSLLESTA